MVKSTPCNGALLSDGAFIKNLLISLGSSSMSLLYWKIFTFLTCTFIVSKFLNCATSFNFLPVRWMTLKIFRLYFRPILAPALGRTRTSTKSPSFIVPLKLSSWVWNSWFNLALYWPIFMLILRMAFANPSLLGWCPILSNSVAFGAYPKVIS